SVVVSVRAWARCQSDPGLQEPAHALVATRPAEDEVDRRQHPCALEDLDDVFAAWNERAGARPASLTSPRRAIPHLLTVERDDIGVRDEVPPFLHVHRMEPVADQIVVLHYPENTSRTSHH